MFCRIHPYGKFFVCSDLGIARDLLCRLEFAKGGFPAALELAEEELRVIPSAKMLLMKAQCLDMIGRREEAITLLQENLEYDDERKHP